MAKHNDQGSEGNKKGDAFPKLLMIAAVIAIILALMYYKSNSDFFTALQTTTEGSNNTSDFGAFGDYFGGVLNPTLAFFGLMALLHTIKLQVEEMRATREEFEKQSQHYEREEDKQDIFRVIETLRNRITLGIEYEIDALSIAVCTNSAAASTEKSVLKKRVMKTNEYDHIIRKFLIDTRLLLDYLAKYKAASHIPGRENIDHDDNALVTFFENEARSNFLAIGETLDLLKTGKFEADYDLLAQYIEMDRSNIKV